MISCGKSLNNYSFKYGVNKLNKVKSYRYLGMTLNPWEWLNALSQRAQRTYHLFFCSGRTMFLMCDSNGNLYFVDSHLHRDRGALIASVGKGNGHAFADWIDKMMTFHWNCPLNIGSVTEVVYAWKPTDSISQILNKMNMIWRMMQIKEEGVIHQGRENYPWSALFFISCESGIM